MPERRPFPPSPRRRALARQAGLTGASPLLVGAAAIGAAAAASAMLARAAAATLGGWLAGACDHAVSAATAAGDHGALLGPAGIAGAVLELAAPLLGIAAIAAIAVHLAQTRGVWLPRRRIEGAPALPADAGSRTRAAAFELLATAAVGATAFGWLWLTAPSLARLVGAPAASQAALAIAAFLATVAIAWVALGAFDALLRQAALGRALSMTAQEKRADDRLAGADPRWRARRAALARADRREDARRAGNRDSAIALPAREAIAASTLLLLGDDVAVAIAWDPIRRPTPVRITAGTGALATQLLAHARRQALPVHRDAALAAALAVDPSPDERTIPEAHWPRLAEIIAAVRNRSV